MAMIADMPEVSRVHVTIAIGRHVAETYGIQLPLQDSGSADEIECSSEEDVASPAYPQAATASAAIISKQKHARVRTKTTYM